MMLLSRSETGVAKEAGCGDEVGEGQGEPFLPRHSPYTVYFGTDSFEGIPDYSTKM